MFYWKSYQRSFAIFPRHQVEQNIKYTEALRGKWEKNQKTPWKLFPTCRSEPSCTQIKVQGKLVRVTIVWIFHHQSIQTQGFCLSPSTRTVKHMYSDSDLPLVYSTDETAALRLVLHVLLPAVSPNKPLLSVFSVEVSVAPRTTVTHPPSRPDNVAPANPSHSRNCGLTNMSSHVLTCIHKQRQVLSVRGTWKTFF